MLQVIIPLPERAADGAKIDSNIMRGHGESMRLIYTIEQSDVGKGYVLNDEPKFCPHCKKKDVSDIIYLPGLMGKILPHDVGKRIYAVPSDDCKHEVHQVENDEQLERRLAQA